jgi:hypothetical protein
MSYVILRGRWWDIIVLNVHAPDNVALENLDTEVDVKKSWEAIRENIKISAKERQGYYEAMVRRRMLKIIIPKKQAKLQ